MAGQSYAELTIYKVLTGYSTFANRPSTPVGGSHNFATGSTITPSGWSKTFPTWDVMTQVVYASTATALASGTGTDTSLTWSTPQPSVSAGWQNVIYRRASSKPSTPGNTQPTSPIPSGWSDSATVSGTSPLWSVFGRLQFDSTTFRMAWLWDAPIQVEGQAGLQGPQGDTGARGPQGNTGAQGATGSRGATGPSAVVPEFPVVYHLWSTQNEAYSPTTLTQDAVVRFRRDGVVIATRTVRSTRSGNTVTNASIAVATVTHVASGVQVRVSGSVLNLSIGGIGK